MIRLNVRVHPGARLERLEPLEAGGLGVWVRAPALGGRANAALCALVARAVGLRRREVRIVSGERARTKVLELDLPSHTELSDRLAGAPGARAAR